MDITVTDGGHTMTDALQVTERQPFDELAALVVADKSDSTRRKYTEFLGRFADWLLTDWQKPLSKQAIAEYRRHLAGQGLAPATINAHLSAVRQLLREAADLDLLDPAHAERMASVEGVRQQGERLGYWLNKEDAQRLLDAPDTDTLKGKRDRAILALTLFCGLRRSEMTSLSVGHLQEREGHTVIADLLGKAGRVRSVKVPVPVKRAIDAWLDASGRDLTEDSPLFVALRKGDQLARHESLTDQAIYKLVVEYAEAIGKPDLRPHDLRRTFAKLARSGGSELEQISLTLGHAKLETTQRYLGTALDLDNSAPDRVGLEVNA